MKKQPWPYQIFGSKKHPAVVFLHGFMGDSRDWEFLIDACARDYYCIFPDLPGHGRNQAALPVRPLSFRWLAGGLQRLLAGLDLPAAHWVGYSLGGRAALYFTVHHPQQVRSLTLESASPGLSNRRERAARRELDVQRAADLLKGGLDSFIEDWYHMPLFRTLHAHPQLMAQVKARRTANDPVALARVIAELSPGRQTSLWNALPAIQPPVLLLAGALDLQYSHLVGRMAQALPNSQIALAPQAGHNIHLESPEWYLQQLLAFLGA